ncbi:MAG: CvpA family protein, partial [Clostridiales Family XIII bacterium]|nr:CvpA family protein [Clostridiales Family XIII bacterium]
MPIDIAILIIILIFALLGFRRGFAYTFFRTFGWIVAIVAAILLRGRFADFLAERTSLYDVFLAHTEKIFHTFAEKYATGFAESMPVLIGDAVEKAKDKIVSETAVRIADASFEIFAFIGLILLIKIALFILTLLLSKRHHEGFIGGIDGIGGFFIGAAQGVVVVLILSA